MKKQSIFGKIKDILPVSRKTHERENQYLHDQLNQAHRRNLALQTELAKARSPRIGG